MSQAILISENEIINSLYEMNLRAYVATNVTIKNNLSMAIDLLKQNPSVDVIICFSLATKKLKSFQTFLSDNSLDIPIIVLGELSENLPNTIHLKNRYDIKGLLQAVAKILEVTAKEMASMSVAKYFPIPIKMFSQIDKSHCDIYNREKKEDFEYEYKIIIEKEALIGELFNVYSEKGIDHLYVEATQRLYFINKASRTVVGELNRNDISIEERIEIAEQGMSVVAQDAFENGEISKEIADISKACIESINNVVNEVPDVRKLLGMLLENQSGYCYKHSIITTFLANQIIGKISWGSAEQQEKVAFSLFFHDIYLIEIYKKYPEATSEEDLLFIEGMLESEKQTIIDHAKMAGDLVKSFPRCPMGADTIITQHHGMTSGQGFAINYKDDISPLAKIMIIAEDIAVSLLSQTETRGKITIDKEKVCGKLNEKYRNHTYKKVIKAFQEAKI